MLHHENSPFFDKPPVPLILTKELLDQGVHASTQHFLDEYLQANGAFSLQPEGMAFIEKSSTLVDSKGKKITSW